MAASQASAITKFLIIAPGNSYDGASAPALYQPTTQVAGETFTMEVFCYDDSDNLPRNSNPNNTSLSASGITATFNPSGLFDLPDSYGSPSVPNSRRQGITAVLEPTTTQACTVTAATGGGIGADTTAIWVQKIDHFNFNIGSFTAGSTGTLTIEARDSSNALCSAYNGTATLTAYDAGVQGASVSLGNITFVNGVYTTSSLIFYHATSYARFQVVKSNSPAVTTTSSNFTISPATFSKLLILGPGQSVRSGENGGNGRASGSNTTTAQTAGTNFTLTVYAADAYWNTRTAGGETVSLTSEDPAFSIAPQAFGGGASSVTFSNVNLHTVGDGYILMTASDTVHADNTDIVPLSSASLDHFVVNTISSPKNAGTGFSLTVTAYDQYGNTATSVSGTTSVEIWAGGSQVLSSHQAWTLSPTLQSSEFTGDGRYVGTLTINKAFNNYLVRVTHSVIGDTDSNFFNVQAGTPYKFLIFLPGQTFTPGEYYTLWGRSGTPADVTAGTPISVSLVATDQWGNQVNNTYNGINLNIERTDAGAVFATPVTMANGNTVFSMTFTTAYTSPTQQRVIHSGSSLYGGNSGYFNVVATTIHHFSVGNISATQTAGTPFNTQISARDVYNNVLTTFTGPIYITCPNLDYHNPEQSVIEVPTYGTSGAPTSVTWTVNSGFVSGIWSHDITVFRAGDAATIFVADNPTGNTITGHVGTSSEFEVVPATHTKVFAIVPGLEYRPGTGGGLGNSLGGYSGSPDAQQLGSAFYVTIYATDAWWNQVSGITGPFHLYSQPTDTNIYGTAWNFNNGNTLVAVIFNGVASYKISIDYDIFGIDDYTTPYFITSISLDHFKITGPGGAALPSNLMAGVPFDLSITAYTNAAETIIASTFNGQANLATLSDYEEPFRVISPQRINFSGGVWTGTATIYRQVYGGITILCRLGNVGSNVLTNPVVHHSARKKMLAIAPGMNTKPGIAPDTYPPGGFPGYTGNPVIQEAGKNFDMKFYLCDDYYNVVTNSAEGGTHSIRISSSDPYPATIEGVGNLPQTVSLGPDPDHPYGAYRTSNFVLFTVGTNAYQTVTVEDVTDTGVTSFTLGGSGVPPINVKHSDVSKFDVQINTGTAKMAGVAFSCTITAQDAYGNTIDDRNGASAFSPTNNVSLSSGSATNTLYPTVVQLPYNGVGYPSLTVYREYVGVGNSITASYSDVNGNHTGISKAFQVLANAFARLITIVTGLSLDGGRYTSQPPTEFIGYSGSPTGQMAGSPVNLRVYACDTYGNVTEGPVDMISITSTDRFAPNPSPVQMDWNGGYAQFSGAHEFAFHTAEPATITGHNDDSAGISDGTTPSIGVDPAADFGLVTIAPGQVLVEGSGNSAMASGIGGVAPGSWYSGVTPTNPLGGTQNSFAASSELSGVYFPVTVAVTDVFGNLINDGNDEFDIRSTNETNPAGVPNVSAPVQDRFSSGIAWIFAKLITLGQVTIYPWDTTNGSLNHNQESRSDIQVVTLGETHFRIWINDVESPGVVTVQAAPATFTVKIAVHDDYNDQVVNTANVSFRLEVFTDPGTGASGNGTLNITYGQTLSGVATITESYTVAETIYIRVSEASGATRPTRRDSPEIRVGASGADHIVMDSDAPFRGTRYEREANQSAVVRAHVYDINDNPIVNNSIEFSIPDGKASTLLDGTGAAVTATAANTDATGTAVVNFLAGAKNETVRITATDGNISTYLDMYITVTQGGGVYPNPCNPLRPDQWANIDYRLDQNTTAKVYIYTLLGDLVWHKEYASGSEGGHAGVNSIVWNGKNDVGLTVANGGYIAIVKVNDQEKYRFKIGVYKEK